MPKWLRHVLSFTLVFVLGAIWGFIARTIQLPTMFMSLGVVLIAGAVGTWIFSHNSN